MSRSRKLLAVFFRAGSGREPVREWLKGLGPEDRYVIGGDIDAVQWAWPVGRPLVDHIRSGIWEVRSSLDNRIARVLFAIADGEMVLLHGFIKKTRVTPPEELELAERRWKTWQGRQQGGEDE
jgi:phage-related protein